MYLVIIILPLLGSIVSGFFGRKVGIRGAQFITCFNVILTTILAVLAFFEVGFNNIPVSIELFRWIDSEWINIIWGFEFDSLTVTMLLPVLIISSLVHIYSISYMSNDPHVQRFFSYLSLFTFMMIILVTGNNYLLMFVGWEGRICLIWLINCLIMFNRDKLLIIIKNNFSYTSHKGFIGGNWGKYNLSFSFFKKSTLGLNNQVKGFTLGSIRRFSTNKCSFININKFELSSYQKDALLGIILGDGCLERAKPSWNTKLRVEQLYPNQEEFVRNMFSLLTPMIKMPPSILNRMDERTGLNTQSLYFWTLRMPCLNYYFDLFYVNKIKIIPKNIGELLTPVGLAYWLMGDGIYIKDRGVILCTDSYIKEDVELLAKVLSLQFGLSCRLHQRKANQFRIYIIKGSIENLRKIVLPFLIPSMKYKIGL